MGTWQKLGIFSLLDEQKTDSLQSGKCQTWVLKLFTFFVNNFVNSTIKIMLFLLSIQLITLGFAAVSYVFLGVIFFPWQIGSLISEEVRLYFTKQEKLIQFKQGNMYKIWMEIYSYPFCVDLMSLSHILKPYFHIKKHGGTVHRKPKVIYPNYYT